MSCLKSQEMRTLAPELDPLRIGTGWKPEDLSKPQILIESTYGDSHPGSGHLNVLVEEVRKGVAEAGGFGARYYCTDINDEAQSRLQEDTKLQNNIDTETLNRTRADQEQTRAKDQERKLLEEQLNLKKTLQKKGLQASEAISQIHKGYLQE